MVLPEHPVWLLVLTHNHLLLSSQLIDTLVQRIIRTAGQLDVIGLLLLGATVSLILLPLTLAGDAKNQWRNRTRLSSRCLLFVLNMLL